MTSETEKRALALKFLEALRSRNWIELRSVFTEDAVWHLPGASKISGPADGAEAVVERARLIASYGLSFTLKHILIGKDGVALSLNNTATRDGIVLDEHLATVCQIRDGKISRIDTYLSDVGMMDAFFV